MHNFQTHTHKQEHGCWTLDFFVSDIKLQAIYKVIHTSNYDGHISKYVCKIDKYNQRGIISRLFEIRRTEHHKDRQYCQVCRSGSQKKIICLCILFCTGNRKCNWYAGTITVNLELHSASNDIYFLNMQLFPW